MNNQMNSAVRKIHNLLSSGAVTVTGPNQPRILKQKVGSTTVTPTNNLQQVSSNAANRCYICDDLLGASQAQHPLTEMSTTHTATKFPNKIGQLVGDAFMVIVSVDDVVCSRCTNLLNYLDRLENDVERVRTNLMNLLHKKYGLNDEGGGGGSSTPPIKMQKLNSGTVTTREEVLGEVRTRKIIHNATESPLGKQSPPVSAVQQIKISTQPTQQNTAGTQTLQRKTTKIYKCLSCDYKTSDMRLFNTHYETCKQQNFQCKNCKKIFPNFGAMKQHMVREHNTPMDNTCAVCHINFVNEAALRKHMEMNHSTNVVVTSTTTLPATPIDSITSGVTSTPLYTCNHCQFKSTDKVLFDEHLRKHLSGVKPKPFKCRLCAARFETREAATVHAKQHQPNYFKCGTCSMSFPKRELLVKHFEVHQQQPQQPAASVAVTSTAVVQQTTTTQSNVVSKQQQQQHQQQSTSSQNMLTQKLLQDTIDEALSDTSTTTAAAADVGSGNSTTAAAGNIRFFSCSICSLTFIQENYYNQHMETHRRDKKGGGGGSAANVGTTITTSAGTSSLNSNNGTASITSFNSAAAALLSDSGLASSSTVSKSDSDVGVASAGHQSNSSNVGGGGGGTISEADIESIFEKMHSDKGDTGADSVATSASNTVTTNTTSSTTGAGGAQGDNLVITSQEGSGGITFNITIPQPDAAGKQQASETSKSTPTSNAPVSVSIDMPMLDQPDETITASSGVSKTETKNEHLENEANDNGTSKAPATSSGPVSMPSLDDDNDSHDQHASKSEDGTEKEVKKENSEAKDSGGHDGAHDDEQVKTETDQKDDVKAEDDGGAAGALDEHTTDGDGGEGESGNADGHHQQVSMELDEAMQAQVESGQIKFILNENGQLLQLDNHIITDADGNQILVQDPEQIQQLLQSVGVLQSGDGLDGETLQMMTDANGQMVLVQGENNETQLIDASLLNADGQLVIQQGQDGDLGEGAHVIGEDGTRIPVSVSYTADGQPIVQVQQQHLEAAREASQQHHALEKDGSAAEGEGDTPQTNEEEGDNAAAGDATASGGNGSGSGGGFFELEELMQQSSEAKAAE